MRVLKVLFVILLIFTVIWCSRGITNFSTVDSALSYFETFSNEETLIDVIRNDVSDMTEEFRRIKFADNWWSTTVQSIKAVFKVIALPISFIVSIGGWFLRVVYNFIQFLYGSYIIYFD